MNLGASVVNCDAPCPRGSPCDVTPNVSAKRLVHFLLEAKGWRRLADGSHQSGLQHARLRTEPIVPLKPWRHLVRVAA